MGPIVAETLWDHRASQHEVTDFVGRLKLGLSRDGAERIEREGGYLKFHATSRGTQTWYYDTPPTFGGDNWVVTIEFDEEGLACATVGTADDTSRAPAGAPPAPCREGRPPAPRRPKPID